MRNPITNSATDVGFLARRRRTRNPTYKRYIFLVGFSGSGKSTIGSRLARLLKTEFYDTDMLIEQRCGKPIDRIFSDDGEATFRRLESQVINELINRNEPRMVIALGAGAFEKRKNWNVVKRNGTVVYLSCSVREIYKRLKEKTDRPLLRVLPAKGETQRQAVLRRIKDLLGQRRQTYAQADVTISTTNKSMDETVRQLCRKIQSCDANH
jgi:shikimate kinase